MKSKTILSVLLFWASFAWAQEPELKPVTINESLENILGMVQDKYGYIWLADSGNGLFKYDGKKTINFKPITANPNSLSSGRIENMIIDKDGIFWLGHFDAGLDRFDSEANIFTHYGHDDQDSTSIYSNATRDVIEDLDGNLWVGTNMGVDKFDKESGKFIHDFSNDPDAAILREEHIRKMYLDKSGIIWIGTGSAFFGEETTGGLFRLNPRTGEIDIYRHTEQENSLIDNRVRAIFEDSRGVFWIGTAGDGLHTMNRDNGTFTRHTYDPQNPKKLSRPPIRNIFTFGLDHITFIEEDDDENIWIGTFGNGIIRYNPYTEMTDHYGPNESGKYKTDNAAYWEFLKTSDGLFWFAAFNAIKGLELSKLEIAPSKLKFHKRDGITAFKQDTDGTIYVGTFDGVQTLNNEEFKSVFKTYDINNENGQIVREISLDANGNIWAGTAGAGLFYYNKNKNELRNYRYKNGDTNSLSNDYIGSILIQENHEIFIGTSTGLDILNTSNHGFEHFELKNEHSSSNSYRYFKSIAVDGQNRIWVGGMGGIYRFEREKGIFIKYDLGIGTEIITALLIDIEGVLWIGTINRGLRKYNEIEDTFESILDETGFLNKYSDIISLTQDRNNEIWMKTFDHIIKYNIKSTQGTLFEENWLTGDKLFNISSIQSLTNGELLLGGQSGYVLFDPDSFKKPASEVQKPFIEKLIIGMKTLNSDNDPELYNSFRNQLSVELPYDQNDLSFKIGYIDYENHLVTQPVSYKLENYDKQWRNGLSGNLATYYHLPPGKYIFMIKAQDIYGNWGEKKLSIDISSPWYLTIWAYLLYAFLFITGVIFVHRFQKNRLLKKAMLESKEKELKQAKKIKKAYDQLEIAHNELKATQSQLIQSEKMASLGELTAGIAHEIQNPLNFVNNFSEVSEELIVELEEEIEHNSISEIKEIIGDLKQNLNKINHHGKRASGIVKGMLDHSRTSKGEKELTDINVLADEYLRLSYHGLRAKDRTFNADFKIDLDETIPKINIVPQDLGRVILNLINNAFYAVSEKRKKAKDDYQPTVTVSTKLVNKNIQISVEDNGMGIPKELVDKIFQPFFTTKPTGEGTGLGLSLAYDIITKGHGGTITVDSKKGIYTKFTIVLPIKKTE